jgi:hypothetical protein
MNDVADYRQKYGGWTGAPPRHALNDDWLGVPVATVGDYAISQVGD